MIIIFKEPRKTSGREVDQEFDGQWVLLNREGYNGDSYLLAYGDSGDSDRDELRKLNFEMFNGSGLLTYGYKNRGKEMLHVL